MITDSPCSTLYHEWQGEEHMASRPRHEPSKPHHSTISNQGSQDQRTSPHVPRGVGEKKAGSWRTRARCRARCVAMPYIAPRRHKPRAATNTGSTSLPPNSNCCIGPSPDGQDHVFKKITTLWCRRRLVRSPDLGFPPASDGRGVTVKAMNTPSRRKWHPLASPCSASASA
jgi:hypothetical protein